MKRIGIVVVYVVAFALAGMSIATALDVLTPASYVPSQDVYKARISPTGTAIKGTTGTSSVRISEGTYAPRFSGDVSECIYSATLSAKKTLTTVIDGGGITVTPRASNPNEVLVHTFSSGNTRDDHGFDIVVFCNTPPASPSP